MSKLLGFVTKDWQFYVFICVVMMIAILQTTYIQDPKWFIPNVYVEKMAIIIPIFLVNFIAKYQFEIFFRKKTYKYNFDLIFDVFRSRAHGFLLFFCILIFNGCFTSMKSMLPAIQPFAFDPAIADIDEFIHQGPAWIHVRFLDGMTGIIRFLYSHVWFLLTTGVTMIMCLEQPGRLRSQYIWTFLLCWTVLGLVVAGCFMSVGPIFYDRLLGDDRFIDLTTRLSSLVTADDVASQYPDHLWFAYITQSPGMGTGISAFPSLHLAMATLLFLTALRISRWLGAVMLVYLGIIMLGSVHLGWHYGVDGYFSIIATTAIWKLVGIGLNASQEAPEPQKIAGPCARPLHLQ